MTIANGYATGAELESHMSNQRAGFAVDAGTEQAIEAVSREIDGWCGRRFWADATTTARTFYAGSYSSVMIDDALEVTAMTIDGVSADPTDYDLWPLNGVQDGVEGWPTTRICLPGDGTSPTGFTGRVVVTAKWGWAAVPAPVTSACLLLAAELVKTGDIPMIDEFGSGSSEMKAVYRMLRPFRRGTRAVPVA